MAFTSTCLRANLAIRPLVPPVSVLEIIFKLAFINAAIRPRLNS